MSILQDRVCIIFLSFLVVSCNFTEKKKEVSGDRLTKPNIIIIMADDLGYGDLSCYGGKIPTPHLDQMAAEGLKFTDFHSSGTVCSPTRAGLVTGSYQQRTKIDGVVNADSEHPAYAIGMDPNFTLTYPNLLKEAGYKTAIFGKWHLGYKAISNPMNFGYDAFRGFVSGNIDYHSHYDRMEVLDWYKGREKVEEEGYSTHLITKYTKEFIQENKDESFCIYVAHEAVHAPMQGPSDPIFRGPDKVEKDEARPPEEVFIDMLTALDKSVGEILAEVKAQNLSDNTLVIFLSDNGPMPFASAGELRGRKSSVYEGGHRVPTIFWSAKLIEANSVSNQTAISIDIVPTILDLAEAKVPYDHQFDGLSLLPVFRGDSLEERLLYWRTSGLNLLNRKTTVVENGKILARDTPKAVRSGEWKLVASPYYQRIELYNLKDDIGESNDLAEEEPEIAMKLTNELKTWEAEMLTHLPYKVVDKR